ncbi:MAG: DUF2189 domain-containing protein [Chromatiales bacterium]|nr:DUF2189 domain-containing protein [Chromatiales bacterium]
MLHTVNSFNERATLIAHVNDITLDRPWQWLVAGWRDLKRAPAASIGYGAIFVVVSYALTLGLFFSGNFYLLLPLAAGFFLVAPMLGIGLYEISRRLEKCEQPSLWQAIKAWKTNLFHVMNMGVVLVVALLAWLMVANLIFVGLFQGITPTPENFLPALFTVENAPLLLVGTAVGAVIAFCILMISAVSIPMMLDRKSDVFSAMHTSVAACRYNLLPMLFWGALIVTVICAGMLTLYVGLALGFPIVGHATWHAYKDMVKK